MKVQNDNDAQVDDHHFDQFNSQAREQQIHDNIEAENGEKVAHQVPQNVGEQIGTTGNDSGENCEKRENLNVIPVCSRLFILPDYRRRGSNPHEVLPSLDFESAASAIPPLRRFSRGCRNIRRRPRSIGLRRCPGRAPVSREQDGNRCVLQKQAFVTSARHEYLPAPQDRSCNRQLVMRAVRTIPAGSGPVAVRPFEIRFGLRTIRWLRQMTSTLRRLIHAIQPRQISGHSGSEGYYEC